MCIISITSLRMGQVVWNERFDWINFATTDKLRLTTSQQQQ